MVTLTIHSITRHTTLGTVTLGGRHLAADVYVDADGGHVELWADGQPVGDLVVPSAELAEAIRTVQEDELEEPTLPVVLTELGELVVIG